MFFGRIQMQQQCSIARGTAAIAASYSVSHVISPTQLLIAINVIGMTLIGLSESVVPDPDPVIRRKPAVPISKSIGEDYLICLEDGAKLKMLRRYLGSRFNMTPEEYRRKWGLPFDYPMTAPAYAARRSECAMKIGLGRNVRGRK